MFCGKSLKLAFCPRVRFPIPSDVSLKKSAVPSPTWPDKAHVLLLVKRFTKHALDVLGRATFDRAHVDRHHWQAPQCSTVVNRLKLVVIDLHDAWKRAQVGCADANLRGSVWEHLFDLNARESTNLRGRGSERMNTPNPFGNMKLPISCVCAATCMRRRSECAPVISSIMRLGLVSGGPVMIGTSPILLTSTEFDYAKGWIAPTIQTVSSMPLSTNRDENAQGTETGAPARSKVPQIAWPNILVKMQGKCQARHRKRFTFRKLCAYIGQKFGLAIGGFERFRVRCVSSAQKQANGADWHAVFIAGTVGGN